MDKKTLTEKQASISQQFDASMKQYNDLGVELERLRGEYRVVTDLLENIPELEKKEKANAS